MLWFQVQVLVGPPPFIYATLGEVPRQYTGREPTRLRAGCALLPDHHVELFSLAQRQCSRIYFAPLDSRSRPLRDSRHIPTDVDSHDRAGIT